MINNFMNGGLHGADVHTAGTGIIFLMIGYFVGTFLFTRVYISLFRGGDTTYVDPKDGVRKQMPRFGTSGTGRVFGIKYALAHFISDFGKIMVGYGAIIYPLQLFVPQFGTALPIFFFVGAIIGNNGPVGGKFKGGVGVAAAFGMMLSINGFVAILGITSGALFLKLTKQTGLSALLGAITASVLIAIPAFNNLSGGYMPGLDNLPIPQLTTHAALAYSLGAVIGIMTLKRIKASGSYARMAKKLITLDFKSGGTSKNNRFVSADDQ